MKAKRLVCEELVDNTVNCKPYRDAMREDS